MDIIALRLTRYIALTRNGVLRVWLIDLQFFLHDLAMYLRHELEKDRD